MTGCHDFGAPVWTMDSRALLVTYSPPPSPRYDGSTGTCESSGRVLSLVVPATAGQARLRGAAVPAESGCQDATAAAMTRGYVLVVEACGTSDSTGQPMRLLLVDPHLRIGQRIPLGRCTQAGELTADERGAAVLVGGSSYCPADPSLATTRLWRYTISGGLRLIMAPNRALDIVNLTW